jgi:16S rRNA A1518/A1519 N6-dimethyltransferase RsmA/KsgA/DIM1 with predicted DNA glycosylase/AP lyase activity
VNALAHSRELGLSKAAAGELLQGCGIDPTRRAETLGTEDFLRLAEAIAHARGERPS